MTEKKTKASPKPKTARAQAPKKVQAENPDRVAVLRTHVGHPLIIRANPTEEAVLGFVEEQNRRYHAGEPAGPSGQPAFLVVSGMWFESEAEFEVSPDGGTPINL